MTHVPEIRTEKSKIWLSARSNPDKNCDGASGQNLQPRDPGSWGIAGGPVIQLRRRSITLPQALTTMGILALETRPPASGAIIFYKPNHNGSHRDSGGVAHSVAHKAVDSSTSSDPKLSTIVYVPDNASDSTSTSSTSLTVTATSNSAGRRPSEIATSTIIFNKLGDANVKVVISLIKDISEIFKDIPYIKIVAGLVNQIITISEEVQANKERSQELVEKVLTYARVVFDGLIRLNKSDFNDIKDLEDDLMNISKVFQSILDILQNLSSKGTSRIGRLLYRDDMAKKIAQEDRRLDVSVTAFQIKSAIALRVGTERPEREAAFVFKPPRVRHPGGLKAKPQIVFGRTEEINIIVAALAEPLSDGRTKHPRICILGTGGIGKTTLALSIAHNHLVEDQFREERYFVPCEAASSPELLLHEIATSLGVVDNITDDKCLQHVQARLQRAPVLLILDNFETPWDPPTNRILVESLLSEITSIDNVAVLVTMRGSQYPTGTAWDRILPPLRPIAMDSAISVFEAIGHKADKYAIQLLKAVDCVPLAVTLIANMAAVDGEPAEVLWARWQNENTSMIGDIAGQDRLTSVETSVRLSVNSPRMKREPGGLLFLSAMALLPDGMTPETLSACDKALPDIPSVRRAVSILRQNALIYEDASQNLRVLSPIRHYVQSQHPPSESSRQFMYNLFLRLAIQGSLYHEPTVRSRLSKEAGNISSVLLESLQTASDQQVPDIVESIISFCHYTYVSGKGSTQVIALAIQRLNMLSTAPVSLRLEGKKEPSKFRFRLFQVKPGKVRNIATDSETLPIADPLLQLQANCLGCWGQLLTRQSDFDLAQEKFEEAKDLHIRAGDVVGHAYDMLNIGLLLSRWPECSAEVLDAFDRAAVLHDQVGDKAGKAFDFMGAGHFLRSLFRYDEAEVKFNKARTLFLDIADESGQASALNGLGTVLKFRCQFSAAERQFTEAARLCIKLGDDFGQAENMAGIAGSLLLRSRWAEAQVAIEKAISLREPVVDPDHLHTLGRIFIAKGQYKQAREILLQSQALHKDVGDAHGCLNNEVYLASICFHLGERDKAIDLARTILETCSAEDQLIKADGLLVCGQVYIRDPKMREAELELTDALKIFEDVGSLLGQARCHHLLGICDMRHGKYDHAMMNLTRSLDLHTQVGNVQSQADDLNKICELLIKLAASDSSSSPDSDSRLQEAAKLANEALALHIEIGSVHGKADDLYILASISAARDNFVDAERTIRQALETYRRVEGVYGQARAMATLGDILWRKMQLDDDAQPEVAENPIHLLEQAIDLFFVCRAGSEMFECVQQKRKMKSLRMLKPNLWIIPDWDDGVYRPYWVDEDSLPGFEVDGDLEER